MSERERPSLSSLTVKKPLVDRGRPVVPLGEAEAAILGPGQGTAMAPEAERPSDRQSAGPPTVLSISQQSSSPLGPQLVPSEVFSASQSEVQPSVLSPTRLKPRHKDPKIAWTFKMPLALHRELTQVAAHNDLAMTDIVIEALRFHLPNFDHPAAGSKPKGH